MAKEIGPIAKPRQILVVAELPKTRSGKIMRGCCATWRRTASSATSPRWRTPSVMDLISDGPQASGKSED